MDNVLGTHNAERARRAHDDAAAVHGRAVAAIATVACFVLGATGMAGSGVPLPESAFRSARAQDPWVDVMVIEDGRSLLSR